MKDSHALAAALLYAAILGQLEGSPGKVERLASDLIELSMRQNFSLWLPGGELLAGWVRCVSGNVAEGILWIEDAIRDFQTTGSMLLIPYQLTLKAEALHLADRTTEALETIREAEALAEKSEERWWRAELYRLKGMFLAATGADESQTQTSFRRAISTATQQKSLSLTKRAEATYAEYCRQKPRD